MNIFDAYSNFYMNLSVRAEEGQYRRRILSTEASIAAQKNNRFVRGGNEVLITAQEFFVSLSVTLKGGGAWDGALVLFDPTGDGLENMLLAGGQYKFVKLQWGWLTAAGDRAGDPVWEGTVVKMTPQYTEAGTLITIELVANGAYQVGTSKESTFAPRGADVVELVKAIANRYGMYTQVDGRETIQRPSNPKLPEPINRAPRSVWQFLRELADRSNGPRGRSKFEVYLDERNVLHFHDAFFLRPGVVAAYQFGRDTFGDMVSFQPEDATLSAALRGAQKAEFTCIDSFRGTRLATGTDINNAPERVAFTVGPDESFVSVVSEGLTHREHITARTEEAYREKLIARMNAARSSVIRATAEVKGTHAISLTDYVQITYYMRSGQEHYLSGTYRANEVNHEVTTSGWTTALTLSRQGTKAQQESQSFNDVTQIAADYQAPDDDARALPYYVDATPRSRTQRKQVRGE